MKVCDAVMEVWAPLRGGNLLGGTRNFTLRPGYEIQNCGVNRIFQNPPYPISSLSCQSLLHKGVKGAV